MNGLPIMGGARAEDGLNNYISRNQAGRFHRNLSLFNNNFANTTISMNNYVKEKHSYPYTYLVESNQTWDFGMKMYQDIYVRDGNTLEIKCELRMPINGKIHVEKGAKLIINGGHITCAHEGEQWSGIYVGGDVNFAQTIQHQGMVVMKNNALIEHASVGVRLYSDLANYQTAGGILIAENSTFLTIENLLQW